MGLPIFNQFLPLFLAVFLITWMIVPLWIHRAKKAGLVGRDMHKKGGEPLAEIGGVVTLFSFIVGIIGYVALRVFLFKANTNITSILAILTAILLAGVIGLIDDILGWKIGLTQWQKPLLTLLVAAPVMAVNAGNRVMYFPLTGPVDLGMVYPLIIIPFLILIGTNGFNMLAGYNGLEAGQGIIILSTMAYFSYLNSSAWLAVVSLCMVFALGGFLIYNRYPAKIFPGDTLTYSVGALAAAIAIFANLEKIFLILFIPYLLQFLLKLRGRFQKESFARLKEDGTLTPGYEKTYGLENLAIRILNGLQVKTTERKVVLSLHVFQLVFVLLAFIF